MLNNWDRWGDKAIRRENLQISCYYAGVCRNARIARWDGQKFIHWRTKFDKTFLEDIEYWDIDGQFDGFIPIFEIGYELPAPIDILKYNNRFHVDCIINGKKVHLEDNSYTYEQICEMLNLEPSHNPSMTVAYPGGDWPDRCVTHKQYVTLTNDCIINACYTGNA